MAADVAQDTSVQRYTRQDLEAICTGETFKAFCKLKCAECAGVANKRFSSSMPSVVTHMFDSCWCNECGRVLCEKHRYQHTCERLDQQKERNKNLTKEQLAAQLAEAEALGKAMEEKKTAERRTVAEAAEKERLIRKDRRKVLAMKARHVEGFLQTISRDTEANEVRGTRVRDELFELYTRARRLSLTLYNEFEEPSMPGLAEEDFQSVKEIYERTTELTHMVAMTEDGRLDMRNPWDPPPRPQNDGGNAADGGGFGRGLM